MGNPNQHAAGPLPLVAVGGGAGAATGTSRLRRETPVGNLWLGVATPVRQLDGTASATASGSVEL